MLSVATKIQECQHKASAYIIVKAIDTKVMAKTMTLETTVEELDEAVPPSQTSSPEAK